MSMIKVAKAAGVSTATVSRVLNEVPGVSGEVVRRVQAAVAALQYDPERARRGPRVGHGKRTGRRQRTGNIAVLTVGQSREWLGLPVMASVVAGIGSAASEHGYQLVLSELPDARPESLRDRASELLQRGRVDGAIVFLAGSIVASAHEGIFAALRAAGLPIVWAMGMELTVDGVDHVATDNIRTGCLAHEYLQRRGCEEVAFLTTNPEWKFMRLRGQSFLNASCDAGRPGTTYLLARQEDGQPGLPSHIVEAYGRRVVTAPTIEGLAEQLVAAARTCRAAGQRPLGLFCGNDGMTVAIYPLLARLGGEVGRDIVVVSCDNETIRLAGLMPRPASVDIGAEEIGRRAVIRLRARIQRPDEPTLAVHVSPRLIDPEQQEREQL